MGDNIICGSLMTENYPITINIPGYKADFKLSVLTITGTEYKRFVVMDEDCRVIYVTAHTRAEVLIRLDAFLKDNDEIDLKILKDE